jgi:hypothetical protein
LALENDLVRVIRVHYDAHEKLPVHDHPKTPIIYVYLSDAGPVRFKHKGDEPYDLQRPAVKNGGFRMHRGFIETHEVENIGDTSSDFLRVELKTLPIGTPGLSGRFPPPADSTQSATKVEFENANVRIVRVICAGQGECDFAGASNPALEIAFSDSPETSQVRWVTEGSRSAIERRCTCSVSNSRRKYDDSGTSGRSVYRSGARRRDVWRAGVLGVRPQPQSFAGWFRQYQELHDL